MQSFRFIFLTLIFTFCGIVFAEDQSKPDNHTVAKGSTEIVFIIDRSGSMSGLEADTIGGFNDMLAKQQKENLDKAFVTTVLFDDKYELLHDRVAIADVKPITEKDYFVRGFTALLDATGKTIANVKARQQKLGKEKADKVLFVIITDGMENSSQEYSLNRVKQLIEEQKNRDKWEFLFLGANIDAIGVAESIGIGASKAAQYNADSTGVKKNYAVLDKAVSEVRSGNQLDSSWKAEIEEDFKNREKKQ